MMDARALLKADAAKRLETLPDQIAAIEGEYEAVYSRLMRLRHEKEELTELVRTIDRLIALEQGVDVPERFY